MRNKRDTLVMFDVGGVLLTVNFGAFYEKAAALSLLYDKDGIRERFVSSRLDYLACKGLIEKGEYFLRLREIIRPGSDVTDEDIASAMNIAWHRQIEETVRLKESVHRSGYPVGLLSNMTQFAWERLSVQLPEVFDVYDGGGIRVFSHEVRAVKPEIEIYGRVNGYRKVVFIDDREDYLYPCIDRLGWKGIWFTPYIDPMEALRSIQTKGSGLVDTASLKRADSVGELRERLIELGVEIDPSF